MKNSQFRQFVNDKYYEHRDECAWYKIKCKYFGQKDYFRANRYYLKRLWKESQGA